MKNSELINNFINGSRKGKGSNLKIENNKLINYYTCIAFRNTLNNEIVLNNQHYSQTTTIHQNRIKRESYKILVIDNEIEFNSLVNRLEGEN